MISNILSRQLGVVPKVTVIFLLGLVSFISTVVATDVGRLHLTNSPSTNLQIITEKLSKVIADDEITGHDIFMPQAAPSSFEVIPTNLTSIVMKSYDSSTCGDGTSGAPLPVAMKGAIMTNYGCLAVEGVASTVYMKIFSCQPSTSSNDEIDMLFNVYDSSDCASSSFVSTTSLPLRGTGCEPASGNSSDSVVVTCDTTNTPWIDGDTDGLTLLVYECEGCEDQQLNGPVGFVAHNSAALSCSLDRDGYYYNATCTEGYEYKKVAYSDPLCTMVVAELTYSLVGCSDSVDIDLDEIVDDDKIDLYHSSFMGYCSSSNLSPVMGKNNECLAETDDDFCFHVDSTIDYKGVEFSYEDFREGKEPECSVPHSPVSRGFLISTSCGKTARVTDTHLMATTKGFQPAYSLKVGDVLFGDYDQNRCIVTSVDKEQTAQQYFGLNCIHSEVLVGGLRASTFGDFHTLPSWYMTYIGGGLLGSELASSLGKYFAQWFYRS